MREPIRVLHIITRMVRGGAQENTLATVVGIHGNGWESSLATGPALGPEGSLEPECLAAGVRMLRVPELVREISPRQDLQALRRLVQLCRKERPHIVHTHTSKAGILGRLAARSAGVPVVVHTPHGHVFHSYESALKTRMFIALERYCAHKADHLIALTENERREHLELRVGAADRWSVIHSGVDFEPFVPDGRVRAAVRGELGIPDGDLVIGTVGRLVRIKGQRFLIEAFARLGSFRAPLHLLLVGDGELREDLIRQAEQAGLRVVRHPAGADRPVSAAVAEKTVHFVGLRRDVPRLMNAMDLFTLPSLNEGMGRVLVEAMAMELPCIASRVSGIPDVVAEGETGVLVPPGDAEALAAAVTELLPDEERRCSMGVRGRRRVVPAWSRAMMVTRLEELYRALLEGRGFSAPPPRPGTGDPAADPHGWRGGNIGAR